ncbi:LON peptidase substrate-binding domain-containing protein [Streptacidiphilus monticola]|uniref:LON peptidase substrate-binding domain-containing protein n=1 Tax=Streptacidiphilus monticola TaxID=2161674 RepID=A0ABW1G410_9ACTN
MTERLPLFPLSTVLYPGLVLPLHVFEQRYRTMMADLAAGPEPHRFGVVAIRDGQEVAPTGQDTRNPALAGLNPDPAQALYDVGCVAEVASLQRRPDGRYEILASGTTRFRVTDLDPSGPYLTASVEPYPDEKGEEAELLAAGVDRAFATYQKRLAGARESSVAGKADLPDDPTVLSYLVAATVILDTPAKQRLLAAETSAERLREELRLLRREAAILGRLPSLPAVELTRQAFHPN